MLTNIDNLVFDLGGVIFNINRDVCVHNLEKLGLKEAGRLLDLYVQSGDFLRLEQGSISAADFFDRLHQSTSHPVSNRELQDALCSFITELPINRLKALRTLKQKYRIYALSNTNPIMYHTVIDNMFRQEGLTINDYFDGILVSFQEHVCKPDHKIFTNLLERYNLDGNRTLFLDDSPHNCEAAESCGIKSLTVPPEKDFTELLHIS